MNGAKTYPITSPKPAGETDLISLRALAGTSGDTDTALPTTGSVIVGFLPFWSHTNFLLQAAIILGANTVPTTGGSSKVKLAVYQSGADYLPGTLLTQEEFVVVGVGGAVIQTTGYKHIHGIGFYGGWVAPCTFASAQPIQAGKWHWLGVQFGDNYTAGNVKTMIRNTGLSFLTLSAAQTYPYTFANTPAVQVQSSGQQLARPDVVLQGRVA